MRCGEADAGVILLGRGGGGKEGRRPVPVEFYSTSVSKELKGEEETGRRRFSGGSEGGMTALWFGSSCAEEGGTAAQPEMGVNWAGEVAATGPMLRKTKEMVWAGKMVLGPKLSKELDGCRNAS
jgi:hypothetical protein